jgi:hypothetical protein
MMASSVDGDLGFGNGLDMDMGALMGSSEQPTNGLDITAEVLMQFGFDAEMIAWCMDGIPGAGAAPAEPEAAIPQRFQLTRVPGTETFDLDFSEVRLDDLMTLTAPCVLTRLSNCALLRLLYEFHKCGAQHGITVVGRRDFQLVKLLEQLNATQGVVDNVAAQRLFSELPRVSNFVADHLATVTHNHCFVVARDFLTIYHKYTTGVRMHDSIIAECAALMPRIKEIGYFAFSNAVIARIMDNHEHQSEARKGKKHARDDGIEGITLMKCVMEDILNRVERMYDQLDRRGLHEFTYMDSCRVTFGIFHVGLRRWAMDGFPDARPPHALKLRTVDLDTQMVRFHQTLFQGPQFEHLEMDMYTAADNHLATSCVYFNFCSIGGVDGLERYKAWSCEKLSAGMRNHNMPLVSFTVRGMETDAWDRMTSDHLMRLCSMRSFFLTFEPTQESNTGSHVVWSDHDAQKPNDASNVRSLNKEYDILRKSQGARLVPKNVVLTVKVKKARAMKAKTERQAKRDAK